MSQRNFGDRSLRDLVITEAFLVAAVVVWIAWITGRLSGCDKRIENLCAFAQFDNVHRAASTRARSFRFLENSPTF